MPSAHPPSGQPVKFQGYRPWPLETVNDDWGLTPEQQETYVEQFRRILAAKNAWREDRHDYFTLRRFLRARSYDLEKATVMWINNLQFKQNFAVDTILQDFYFGEREQFLVCFPQGYHKTDKMGRPIYIQLLGQVNVSEIKKTTTEDRMLKFHIQEYERCAKVILPVCSHVAKRHIDQTFGIMDVRGVGLSHLTGDVKRLLNLITKYDQDNYPEMLGHICIINAPSYFRMMWNIVKGMLDARTQSKIEILGTNYMEPLLKWVDKENLPDWLGGTSHGSLLDDVGPWSDSEVIAQLGLNVEELRLGRRSLGAGQAGPSARTFEQVPSLRRRSDNQSELYVSPDSSAVDLSAYRSAISLSRNASLMSEHGEDGHRKHGGPPTPRLSSHTEEQQAGPSPGGPSTYSANAFPVPGSFAAIPEQSGGGSMRGGTRTLVQRVAQLEAALAPFRAQAGDGNGSGPQLNGISGGGGGGSSKSAPPGSLLHRVEMLEEALIMVTQANAVALQNQQRLLAVERARQQAAAKSSCCCCMM